MLESRISRIELKKAEDKGKELAKQDLAKIHECLDVVRSDWSEAVRNLALQYLKDLETIKELEKDKLTCLQDLEDKYLEKYYACTMLEKGIWTEQDEEELKTIEEEYYPLLYKVRTLSEHKHSESIVAH